MVAQRNGENQRRTLQLTRERLEGGRGTAFDTERAQTQLSITLALIPPFEERVAQAQYRLGVLVGRPPAEVAKELSAVAPMPPLPTTVAVSSPDTLIRRRPDVAAAERMSPHERMLYHRQHSLPEMKRLKKMCHEKLESKLVEPNSPLWEPLTFILNQWERLTRFCEVPSVPLDTNVVEQMLIIPVRYLAGSFNYKTQNGADVGDRHMSLIATANANGVEPVAYLTECLDNHEDLATRPEYYLPWVYRARLGACEEPSQTGSPPAAPNPADRRQAVEHPLRPGTQRRPIKSATGPPSTTAAPP